VPFTLVHAGKYTREDKLKMQKLNTTQKKNKQGKKQQNKRSDIANIVYNLY